MKAFKFACPVCGQHINADADATGSQIECPTCFQKIVVPQAPAAEDGKFILSASQVRKARPMGVSEDATTASVVESRKVPWLAIAAGILLLGGAAAAFVFRDAIFKSKQPEQVVNNVSPKPLAVPTDDRWKLDLTETAFLETPVVGKIRGRDFTCERAYLQNGTLTLRQGKSGSAELSVNIVLAKQEENWKDNNLAVTPTSARAPKVTLKWKKDENSTASLSFNDGYAMKLEMGALAGGKVPGKIYLCTSDDLHSFVAGTFVAEIKKPKPPKQ